MSKASSNPVLQGLFENDLDMSILTHMMAGDATGSKERDPKLMEIDDLGITSNEIVHDENDLSEEEFEQLFIEEYEKQKNVSKGVGTGAGVMLLLSMLG